MPVPKSKEALYGKIVGANINRGKSMEEAKAIADKAIMPVRPAVSYKKGRKKKGE